MKWFRRGLLVLLVGLALLASAAWFALRGSLPHYDGTQQANGLSAPVTVERDALGTATLKAQSRLDITYTLGYVHAQERFFEMDLMRRRAAGELAELFGKLALPSDRLARAHRMRQHATETLEQLSNEERALINTYRDGVNAGLAALNVRPFPYLLTKTKPAAWRSEDTLLVIDAMFFTLNDAENSRELSFSYLHAALPESAYRFLTTAGGNLDAPLAGPPLALPELPSAEELNIHSIKAPALTQITDTFDDKMPGSNSFAVSGQLTNGGALVANDMHLELRVPNIWFRTRLIYPDLHHPGQMIDVSGASLPGTPAMVVGSNRHVAWAFTNSEVDCTDWVRVTLDANDNTRYRNTTGWQSITKNTETIHVHGAADEALVIQDTEWGPIIAQDADGTPLALAWTAQRPDALNLNLIHLEQAENTDSAIDMAQQAGIPPQNFVVGDKMGNIAWTIAGRIPKRMGEFNPQLPSDWSTGDKGWDGWLTTRDYPLISNPPKQRLWTANQRTMEDPWLSRLGDSGYALGSRARQIRDDLNQRQHFTPDDMLTIQRDDRALLLTRWKELLSNALTHADDSPLHSKLKDVLKNWQGRAEPGSIAYRVVREFRNEVHNATLNGFALAVQQKFPDFALPRLPQAEHIVWALIHDRPQHLLPSSYESWDDLLIHCADRIGTQLDAQAGGISARTWGELNTLRIRHPLSRALPAFLSRFLDMPAQAISGDSNMPRVDRPDFGASERFAVSPGDEEHGYFAMPGGQSGHPLSPYYGAGQQDWVDGTPTPFLPGAAQHQLMLSPVH